MSGDTIGMMEGAFFVGRGELLDWANELLDLHLTKIEQCATGAVPCQIIDAIYPGTLAISKVNFQAKHEYEFVNNFKLLQKAFDKNNITRHIEVEKLVKAKYQDNLEFMQWLKRYFDLNYNGEPYDAVGRRKGNDLYYIGSGNKPVKGATGTSGVAAPAKKQFKAPSAASGSASGGAKKFTKPTAAAVGKPSAVGGAGSATQSKKITELEGEIAELKLTSDTLEKERDFYFGKLRDIEVLLQAYEEQGIEVVDKVFKILYATEDDVVEIDENANVKVNNDAAGEEDPAQEEYPDGEEHDEGEGIAE